MDRRSSLSEQQREAAIAWFEQGHGSQSTAARLGVAQDPVKRLYQRWRIRGRGALMDGRTDPQSYPFELKLALVERALGGESFTELAAEAGLSSPKLLQRWARDYRRDGLDALRPRAKGRVPRPPEAAPGGESELERLQRENELLRAKVAYLGKLKALREQPRD